MDLLGGKSAERSQTMVTASAPAGSGGNGVVLTSSWQGYRGLEERAHPSHPAPACRSQIAECHLAMDQNIIRGGGWAGGAKMLFSAFWCHSPSQATEVTTAAAPIREELEKARANPWGRRQKRQTQPMSLLSGPGSPPGTWAGGGSLFPQPVYLAMEADAG